MLTIGIIREGKVPLDNRVVFTPRQCRWVLQQYPGLRIQVQPSAHRCFSDQEYEQAGIPLSEDMSNCDWLFGIKEVPPADLLNGKTYFIFSHTKKAQPYNQPLIRSCVAKAITLIDYECLVHEDGQRVLGFGFFAGVVGAHNGLKAYGRKTADFVLPPVHQFRDFRGLIRTYFGLKLPDLKIAITGSGRVAAGCIEVMNLLGIKDLEPADFLRPHSGYPVFTQLKGPDLYERISGGGYEREEFHLHPSLYVCRFSPFLPHTDILINGIYWEKGMAPLFTLDQLRGPGFKIRTIADITSDREGSVPCNLGPSTIQDPVYGVDREKLTKTDPYLSGTVDLMAVDNLPNELPRDASRYFGDQLIKYVLDELDHPSTRMLEQATILRKGKLTPPFSYLKDYAYPQHPG